MGNRTDTCTYRKLSKSIISATLLMKEYNFIKKRGGQVELRGGKCSQEKNKDVALELAL